MPFTISVLSFALLHPLPLVTLSPCAAFHRRPFYRKRHYVATDFHCATTHHTAIVSTASSHAHYIVRNVSFWSFTSLFALAEVVPSIAPRSDHCASTGSIGSLTPRVSRHEDAYPNSVLVCDVITASTFLSTVKVVQVACLCGFLVWISGTCRCGAFYFSMEGEIRRQMTVQHHF